MFIIYGNRAKQHAGTHVTRIPCTKCGHSSLSSYGVTRYFHVFWLPVFITSRPFGLLCSNCNHAIDKNELSKQDSQKVKHSLFSPLNTLPFFIGSFLIALLALLIFWHSLEKSHIQLNYLENPHVGDVYCADYSILFPDVDVGKFKHGALRITSLGDDGILFAISKEAYETSYGLIKKISKDFPENDEYYEDGGIVIPYESVKEMYSSGALDDIYRFSQN